MSVFKSPKRKIFRRSEDVGELIKAAADLNKIVEGVSSERWVSPSGFRLKDTNEWCRFYVALKNITGCVLLLILVGCQAPSSPSQSAKAMIPPAAETKILEPKLIKFGWNHPHPESVTFYKLYYGPAPRVYTNFVLSTTTNTTFLADRNALHYFTVTANTEAQESDWSNEVAYPPWMIPRTNVVVITMFSTNGITWTDLKRDTNAVNGDMGLWKLRIE